jgi:hypothetical protein
MMDTEPNFRPKLHATLSKTCSMLQVLEVLSVICDEKGLAIGRHERTIYQLEVANSNTFYINTFSFFVFFMEKKRGSGRLSGKKCETSGTPFQENTLGAKGQGANMLTTFPVSFTWSLKNGIQLNFRGH